MKHLIKFNEKLSEPRISHNSPDDPNMKRFISIVKKHFTIDERWHDDDVQYLGKVNMYEYINNSVLETYNEMKKRLGEYSEYIYEGIMGQRLEELINELEDKVFSINGYLFRVSDTVLETEHNLGRFKEQLQYDDEDRSFINTLDWKYGDRLLTSDQQHKLYSTWDDNY